MFSSGQGSAFFIPLPICAWPDAYTELEYWFNDNHGHKSQVAVGTGAVILLDSNLDVSGLQDGLHILHLRFKDDVGKYCPVLSKYFIKNSTVAAQNIVGYEYWFNDDYGSKISQSISPSVQFLLIDSFATATLNDGIHQFHLRFKDDVGKWNAVITKYFVKRKPDATGNEIVGYRYWFDSLFNQRVFVTVDTPVQDFLLLKDLLTSQVDTGTHVLHLQFTDGLGYWSAVVTDTFQQIRPDSIANDLSVKSVKNPTSSCHNTNQEQLTVEIFNYGDSAQTNFAVSYILNAAAPITDTARLTLKSDSSVHFTFTNLLDLSATGSYSLKVYTSLPGDSITFNDTFQTSITTIPLFTPVVSNDTAICKGTNVTLSASGGNSYLWSNQATGSQIQVSPLVNTVYTVRVTSALGCTLSDSVLVTLITPPDTPSVVPNSASVICAGDSVKLWSSIPGNLKWSTNQNTDTIWVAQSGNYYVNLIALNGCKSVSPAFNLNVLPAPFITTSYPNGFCLGDSVTLTASTGTSFLWSTNDSTQSIKVAPSDTTVYSVSVTNSLNCVSADSIVLIPFVPVQPSPVSNLLPLDSSQAVQVPVRFSWFPSANTQFYDLYYWPSSGTKSLTPQKSNLTSNYSNENLNFGIEYQWQVVSKNVCLDTASSIQRFSTRRLPDLTVQNISVPSSAYSEQTISVTWQIKNVGLGKTGSTSWTDALYLSSDATYDVGIDPYLKGVQNFRSLDSGSVYSNSTNVTLPKGIAGGYYIFVVTDLYDNLLELDDSNNTGRNSSAITVQLLPPPDLKVTSIVKPNQAFSGQQIAISWTVKNGGNSNINATSWSDRVYLSTDTVRNTGDENLGTFLIQRSGGLKVDSTYAGAGLVTLPQNIFGVYYLLLQTDALDDVYEHAFEANNVRASDTLTIILKPPPDLTVTNVMVKDSASNREIITVNWTVKNSGGSEPTVSSWSDAIYISALDTFNLSQALSLGSSTINTTLLADSMYSRSRQVTVPASYSGKYYIYVFTDQGNVVNEYTNESNNTGRSDSIRVLNPDLVVSSIALPASDSSGKAVQFSWYVKNQGVGKLLSTPINDRLYLSRHSTYHPDSVVLLASTVTNAAIASGDSLLVQKQATLPNGISGNYYCFVYTDYNNQVFEGAFEGNNITRSVSPINIKLSPWADLIVDSIATPVSSIAGKQISVTFRIKNNGAGRTLTTAWTDKIYISKDSVWNPSTASDLYSYRNNGSLAASATYQKTIAINLNPLLDSGKYYFYVFTDQGNEVYENTGEGNNISRSNAVIIDNYPDVDLAIQGLTAGDSTSSGSNFKFSYSVKNIGKAKGFAGYWYDAIYLSQDSIFSPGTDALLKEWAEFGPLDSGETYLDSQTVKIPNGLSGNFYLFLHVDRTNANMDADTTNNIRSLSQNGQLIAINVTLTPSPDLRVLTFDAPATGIAGQPVKVSWTVRNEGTGKTLDSAWLDRVYLSTDLVVDNGDQLLGTYNRKGILDTNATYQDSLEIFFPISANGNYILIVKTDATNLLYEHNGETNNEYTSFITINQPPPSDLVVSTISAPATALVNDEITVAWKVKNIGTNPASGMMRDAVYFSKDQVLDINDVLFTTHLRNVYLPQLAEDSVSVTKPLPGLAIGKYYVIVQTDIQNNIYESSDANNTKASDSTTDVTVQQIFVNQLAFDTLTSQTSFYYRLEIADSLAGESLLLQLKGDSASGRSELYIAHNAVPTRSSYDLSAIQPFTGNQNLILPSLKEGTYYIMAYSAKPPNQTEPITLLASILQFEIRSVNVNKGGNNGSVTVKIEGAKFETGMQIRLRNDSSSLLAYNVQYIDPTTVFATFHLRGAGPPTGAWSSEDMPLGFYDVVATKDYTNEAILVDGFEVVEGTGPLLLTNVYHPAATRPNRIVTMTIEIINGGNVDISAPGGALKSLFDAPIAKAVSELGLELTDLNLEYLEPEGPTQVLRPGATSSITVYALALSRLRFKLFNK